MSIANKSVLTTGIIISVLINGCNIRKGEPVKFDQRSIDSINLVISNLYQTNPDKLVSIETQFVKKYNAIKYKPVLIQYYSAMSEYYQYVDSDNYMALSYLNKATHILLDLPGYTETNPYFYINAGNILGKQNFHVHSVNAYKTGYRMALDYHPKDTNAIVVCLDNIAQSYHTRHILDTAEMFYTRAEKYLESSNDIQKAMHYNYRASLALERNQKELTASYANKSLELLQQSIKQKSDYQKSTQQLIYKELSKSISLLAQYYSTISMDSSTFYFEKALEHSHHLDNQVEKSEYVLDYASYLYDRGEYERSNALLEQQLKLIKTSSSYSMIVQFLYAISDNYMHLGNKALSADYLFQYKMYQDSLIDQQSNQNQRRMEMKLARLETDIVMNKLNQQVKTQQFQLDKYRRILFFAVSVILIILSFTLYIFTQNKLKSTQKMLTRRTMFAIEKERRRKNSGELKYKDDYILALDKLMEEDKLFLDKNLRQEDIARHLNTNMSYISKLFNVHYNMRFNDYINEYRIKEACMIITERNKDTFTIDQLYSIVGYKSKSTFYSAFKKFTGLSPAAYIKKMNEKKQLMQ